MLQNAFQFHKSQNEFKLLDSVDTNDVDIEIQKCRLMCCLVHANIEGTPLLTPMVYENVTYECGSPLYGLYSKITSIAHATIQEWDYTLPAMDEVKHNQHTILLERIKQILGVFNWIKNHADNKRTYSSMEINIPTLISTASSYILFLRAIALWTWSILNLLYMIPSHVKPYKLQCIQMSAEVLKVQPEMLQIVTQLFDAARLRSLGHYEAAALMYDATPIPHQWKTSEIEQFIAPKNRKHFAPISIRTSIEQQDAIDLKNSDNFVLGTCPLRTHAF